MQKVVELLVDRFQNSYLFLPVAGGPIPFPIKIDLGSHLLDS
jgi:hypothetical protein